jgi:hypothetical protein
VSACAKKRGKNKGALRLASKCKRSERKVTWSKTGPAGDDAVAPAGAVMHFDLAACPAGWSAWEEGRGRYLVGTPAGGTNGATVGTPLGNQENRPVGQHSHALNDPGHSHTLAFDADQLQNTPETVGGTDQVGENNGTATSSVAQTGITVAPEGAVAGTNAPYVQLLLCRKE